MLLDDPEIAQRRDFLWGFTLLHWAAKTDNLKAIRYLLEAGADPSAQAHGVCEAALVPHACHCSPSSREAGGLYTK